MSGSSGSGGADAGSAGTGGGGGRGGAEQGGFGALGAAGNAADTGGGVTGIGGVPPMAGTGPSPAGMTGGGSAGFANAGTTGTAGAPAGTGGADPLDPCLVPRDDRDCNATCQRVNGVDTCVCNADFFWDGVRCDGPRTVQAVGLGETHSCVIIGTGRVRCWGDAFWYALGTGDQFTDIGDDEPASAAALVDLREPVRGVAAGDSFTCVLLMGGDVRCWGHGFDGETGNGQATGVIDPATAPNVDLGGKAVALSAESHQVCALLDDGGVRCWGKNDGYLGYGTLQQGGLLTPASCGDVELAGPAVQISVGMLASCAVLESGELACWGYVPGLDKMVGDNETPREAGVVDLGVAVKSVSIDKSHGCVVTVEDNVRCWGANDHAQLGYNMSSDPLTLSDVREMGDVDVGGPVKQVVVGDQFSCALLMTGNVRCWGYFGGWAYGSTDTIGDDETPADAGDAPLGGPVASLSAGGARICALMESGGLRCFGENYFGRLGYGNSDNIGDDETPASVGDVPLF